MTFLPKMIQSEIKRAKLYGLKQVFVAILGEEKDQLLKHPEIKDYLAANICS